MARNEVDIPESGAVFTFGRSRFADDVPSHFFIKNDPVVDLSCGDEHSAVVCQKGRLFVFGNNDYGQLGLGHKDVTTKPSCVKLLKPETVLHVACGRAHTIVNTESGKLFSWGNNSEGQLGVGDTIDRVLPTQLLDYEGDEVQQISAGCHHSAVLTGSGHVYIWGSNTDGQLGLENAGENVHVPKLLPCDKYIMHISCGYYHTAFVTDDGELFTFGEGENGKLGLPDSTKNALSPKQVLLGEPVKSVACGGNHTIALTESGKVFAFGSNYNGQIGLGSDVSQSILPTPITKLIATNIVVTACGENHSAFITDHGHLYMCGEGKHGRLCNEDIEEKNMFIPSRVKRFNGYRVEKIGCGGCQSIVLAYFSYIQDEDVEDASLNVEESDTPQSILSPRIQSGVNSRMDQAEVDDGISTRVEHGSTHSIDINGNGDCISLDENTKEDNKTECLELSQNGEERNNEIERTDNLPVENSNDNEKDNDDVAMEPEEVKRSRMARFFSAFHRKKSKSASSIRTGSRKKSAVSMDDADNKQRQNESMLKSGNHRKVYL